LNRIELNCCCTCVVLCCVVLCCVVQSLVRFHNNCLEGMHACARRPHPGYGTNEQRTTKNDRWAVWMRCRLLQNRMRDVLLRCFWKERKDPCFPTPKRTCKAAHARQGNANKELPRPPCLRCPWEEGGTNRSGVPCTCIYTRRSIASDPEQGFAFHATRRPPKRRPVLVPVGGVLLPVVPKSTTRRQRQHTPTTQTHTRTQVLKPRTKLIIRQVLIRY